MHISPGIHESLEMYDFQNIEFAQTHLQLASCGFLPRMDRLPVAKQTIRLRGTL